jgi:phenylalanyl-tRNA synthetase beta chain
MGGEYSGIMDDTNTIVFESACFNGPSVRITAKELGMRTEASARFEKGLDSNGCLTSLERALQLVEMLDDSEEEMIICEACAEEQHALELAIGNKTLEDFEREIF